MNIFYKALGFFALVALPLGVASQTGEDSEVMPAGQEVPALPNDVSSNGSFSYAVPFDLPEFRGLVPNVSLAYNSSNRAFGYERNLTGIGWSLTGFSMIALQTPGGGAPIYGSNQGDTINIFTLDGEPLLACADAAAINAWTTTYPTDYKTDRPSASCSAGGNFASLHEDYRKIEKLSASWEITNPDGTKYSYQNLETLGAGTQAPTFTSKARFLLTSITDVNNNTVNITYTIAPFAKGYATRPATISYAGYTATFEYGDRGYDVTYALGWQNLGRHSSLLEAVTIALNGQKIRAYDLSYELSAETARHRLASVTEYGNDFVYTSANGVVSGSALPPTTFDYSEEVFRYTGQWGTTKQWGPERVHSYLTVADFDNDGIDEIYSPAVEQRRHSNGDVKYTLPESLIKFTLDPSNPNAAPTRTNLFPNIPVLVRSEQQSSIGARDSLGLVSSPNPASQQRLLLVNRRDARSNYDWTFELFNPLIDNASVTPPSIVWASGDGGYSNKAVVVGQFSRDPEVELRLIMNKIYSVSSNGFINAAATGIPAYELIGQGTGAMDLNNDGLSDFLGLSNNSNGSPEVLFGIGNGSIVRVAKTTSNNLMPQFKTGDINGDGFPDLVLYARGAGQINIRLGTGEGFAPQETWASALPSLNTSNFGAAKTSIADVNGDGLGDLIVHNGYLASSVTNWDVAPDPLAAYVYLSTGKSFVPVIQPGTTNLVDIANYVGSGDFNGDGVIDVITEWPGGSDINFGRATDSSYANTPNLLTKVITSQGETIKITYGSTTTNSDHETVITAQLGQNGTSGQPSQTPLASYPRFSGVQQVVSKIWRGSGRWPSRTYEFAYGPAYWVPDLRRFSGYEWVETTLPGSHSGNDLKVRTTFDISSAGLGNVISTERFEVIDDGNGGEIKNLLTQNVTNWQYGPSIRPFKAFRIGEVSTNYVNGSYINGVQNGPALVNTTTYETNIYGQMTETAELGSGPINILLIGQCSESMLPKLRRATCQISFGLAKSRWCGWRRIFLYRMGGRGGMIARPSAALFM